MNKKFSRIFIIFMVLFLFSTKTVYASVSCSEIDEEIKNYEFITEELSKIDCTKKTDSSIVNKCNDLYLKKSVSLTNLYRYKEGKNDTCTSQSDKIGVILDANKDNCSSVTDGMIEKATNKAMTIFYILAPILVIVFGSLDYTKAVVSSNPDLLKKATNDFIKRLVAMVLLFLSPALVNMIIGLNISDYLLSGDGYTCKTNHIDLERSFSIEYVAPIEHEIEEDNSTRASSNTSSSRSSSRKSSKKGMLAGEHAGFYIRTTKPTMSDSKYYDPSISNTGQCVWYVRCRSVEILSSIKGLSESERKKAINTINTSVGVAAYMFWTKDTYKKYFGYSNDVKEPREGAIIVFNQAPGHPYGHVAMVEKVNKKNGKVESIDYTEGWAIGGNSCPNTKMSCVGWQYKKDVPLSSVKTNYMGEPFLGYIYLLD